MANFAQLGIEITSSGVDKAQSELESLANSGGKAETSLKGVEQAATSTDATVKKLSDSALYRANQSLSKYSQGLRDASQESERAAAAARNESDVIAALARERAKAAEFARTNAEATRQSTRATVDWSAEQQKANARAADMASQDAKRATSAQRANAAIQEQQRDLARLIGQIDPAVAALGRLDEQERKLAQFRSRGLIDTEGYTKYNNALKEQRSLLDRVSDGNNKAGMSQRAYSAALRNVPAQFTDIAVSLQAGQAPLTVLLQQGGQLKDMFGGIGPAFRALGGYVLGLINPFTVLAGVTAGLAIAWKSGSDELTAFNQALILTGRNGQITGQNLSYLALEMDKLSGVTTSSASAALTEVANAGVFAADQIGLVATAAENMRVASGRSVSDTVAEFRKLRGDPVSAILALNDSYNFLDQTQLKSIQTLVEQGRQTEAVNLAFQTYANAINDRAPQVASNLGLIERSWRAIKSAAAEAVDSIKDIGRPEDIQRIRALQSNIANIQSGSSLYRGLSPEARNRILKGFEDELTGIQRRLSSRPVEVVMAGIYAPASAQQEEARKAFDARERSLNAEKRLAYEIVQIRKEGVLAGKSQAEVDRLVADYTKKQADAEAKKAASAAKRAGAESRGDISGAQTLIDSASRQIEANNQLVESGEAVSASRRKIIEIDQRLAETGNLMTAAQRAQLLVAKESLATTDAQAKARQQLTRDTAAGLAMEERLTQLYKQQSEQNEISLMGIGRGSQAAEIAQRELNIRRDYLGEVEKLEKAQRNRNTELSAAEYQRQKELLANSLNERLALEQSYQDQRMAMQADWRNGFTASFEDYSAQAANVAGQTKSLFDNAFKGAEDAMVKFAMTGKLSFKDFANSIIADLVRIAAKQAVLQIAGAIAGAFAGGASGGSGVGSTQLGNNYNWGGGFSGGGYTGHGGKYQPAGIVHRGEVVWSQRDVAAVGGPKAANAMRPTAGYATGGIVGSSQPRTAGQSSAPNITFVMNMQDGSITSQQQGGNADESTRELKQMFEAMINQWWTKNSRPGGAVYNGRMGTA